MTAASTSLQRPPDKPQQKDERPGGGGAFKGAVGQGSDGEEHAIGTAGTRKRRETCTARAALLGIVLHTIEGDFGHVVHIATMHALTKSFDDLAQVEAWLDKIGAPA